MSPGFSPQSDAQVGTFRGEAAIAKDAASALADAAEELCLYAGEKVEHKTLDERELATEPSLALMSVEEIMAYLQTAKALDDPKQFADLIRRMQSGKENPQQLARRESRDPTRQYMLMQYALQDGMKNGAGEAALERLRDALVDLEIESGPQIRAGLNTIGAAADFSPRADDIATFQNTYRDAVLGEATLAQTLSLVIERLGGADAADFPRGLQSLIKAVGQDLAAARPSTEPTRLQSLVQDLYHLEVTATVVDNCRTLVSSLAAKHQCAGVGLVPLLKEVIGVTNEKWVGANRFGALADKFGVRAIPAQIAFLAGVRSMLRELPVKVYPGDDVRQSILNAAQEAQDRAIDLEEE